MRNVFITLNIALRTLPAFCFSQVLLLTLLACLLPLLGFFWTGVGFAAFAALGWGYFILHAPRPTPIARATGRDRRLRDVEVDVTITGPTRTAQPTDRRRR